MKSRKQAVLEYLKSIGASPKRSLGQNFLIGEHVIEKILAAAKKSGSDRFLEIGPGLGALTNSLKELDSKLTLVELDRNFAQKWRSENFIVFEEDALKLDWSDLPVDEYCLVSNLPYQISSSLVIDRSVEPFGAKSMVLMFQKEVAQRIQAEPRTKAYGLLTVIAQAAWQIRGVCDAGPTEFYPPPNVVSRVLQFKENRRFSGDWSFFLKFVKAGFAFRRKYLLSNLNSVILAQGHSRQDLEERLAQMGYSEKVRAEEVSVSDWIQLAECFK